MSAVAGSSPLVYMTDSLNNVVLLFTPDGKQVLISGLGSLGDNSTSGGNLEILDAVSRKSIKLLQLGGGSAGILIPPTGDRAYVAVSAKGNMAVGGFTLAGNFLFQADAGGLATTNNATANVFNSSLRVNGAAEIVPGGLVMNVATQFGNGATSFTAGPFEIGGKTRLTINTTSTTQSGILPNTADVYVDNASVKALGFTLTGSLGIGVVNNVFRIEPFDQPAPALAGPGGAGGGVSVADPRFSNRHPGANRSPAS